MPELCDDCNHPIEPGNFGSHCGACMAKRPATCARCHEPIPGKTLVDTWGENGTTWALQCLQCSEELNAEEEPAPAMPMRFFRYRQGHDWSNWFRIRGTVVPAPGVAFGLDVLPNPRLPGLEDFKILATVSGGCFEVENAHARCIGDFTDGTGSGHCGDW